MVPSDRTEAGASLIVREVCQRGGSLPRTGLDLNPSYRRRRLRHTRTEGSSSCSSETAPPACRAGPTPVSLTRRPRRLLQRHFWLGLRGRDAARLVGRDFIARLRGGDVAGLGSQLDGATAPPTWATYIWVENAEDAAVRVLEAGGRVLMDAVDVGDAGRMAVLADPEGAAFSVWQAGRHKGAQIVNEPGALNFNSLNTRDPERARSFYGSVFGWDTLGPGDGVDMWRLAGYGDFLAERDPDLRRRLAETGAAPAGFADVVAALNPITDDQPDTPAHWSVTFAVDDADATADKAAELGGRVLVAPFDAPGCA